MGGRLDPLYRRERAKRKLLERSTRMGECRIWQGPKNHLGYGKMRLFDEQLAHRAAWVAHNGDIPDGMVVMHVCDNPACVEIQHLQLGSVADNNRDRAEKGRSSKRSRRVIARLVDKHQLLEGSPTKLSDELGVSVSSIYTARRRLLETA